MTKDTDEFDKLWYRAPGFYSAFHLSVDVRTGKMSRGRSLADLRDTSDPWPPDTINLRQALDKLGRQRFPGPSNSWNSRDLHARASIPCDLPLSWAFNDPDEEHGTQAIERDAGGRYRIYTLSGWQIVPEGANARDLWRVEKQRLVAARDEELAASIRLGTVCGELRRRLIDSGFEATMYDRGSGRIESIGPKRWWSDDLARQLNYGWRYQLIFEPERLPGDWPGSGAHADAVELDGWTGFLRFPADFLERMNGAPDAPALALQPSGMPGRPPELGSAMLRNELERRLQDPAEYQRLTGMKNTEIATEIFAELRRSHPTLAPLQGKSAANRVGEIMKEHKKPAPK